MEAHLDRLSNNGLSCHLTVTVATHGQNSRRVANPSLRVKSVDGRTADVYLSTASHSEPKQDRPDPAVKTWGIDGGAVVFGTIGVSSRANLYGVAALWPIDPEAREAFRRAAIQNARLSVEREKGCLAFALIASSRLRDTFALVEVFKSNVDFSEHLQTSHFESFAKIARPAFRGDRAFTVKGPAQWTL